VKGVADIFDLSIRENFVHLSSKMPAGEASVAVSELPGLTTVNIDRTDDPPEAPLRRFTIVNFDYTVPDVVCVRTEITQAVPGRLSIVQDRIPLDDEVNSVQLLQNLGEMEDENEPRIGLFVQVTGSKEVRLTYQAKNMIELRRRFPAEVAKYVDPIFRTLHQDELLAKVDTKLAWQVFADAYTPPAEVIEKVNALVKQLDAEDFQARESASKSLEALGQPAALTLRRAERKGWTEEQITRVNAFLAKFKMIDDATARQYRADRNFLIDCLYADDESIRRRAHAQLQKLIGRPIEFDPTAPQEQRYIALRRVRAEIGTPATTLANERAE
jgi:hypothetical protein